MSNNTSNYQVYTFPKLLEQYDKMLVPMIQRDYAQGRTDKKATDVRNNLLTDIFSDNVVNFDLVFGSVEKRIVDGVEKNCFIPVDGQQRLTTLFLLYLYGQKTGKANTKLDLSKFSYDTRRAASDFCKSITSKDWSLSNDKKVSDVIKDSSWFMNYWEKDPTVEGMLNMLDAIHEKFKQENTFPDLENVTFYFFDLESNGLNENLYLKMNSRGKPLTAFENLKAKMEKILPEDVEIEGKCFPKCDTSPKDSFKAKWKYFMDRNWTEGFWDKDNPSKYDVNIAKFIARFLAGYWAAFGQEKNVDIADKLKNLNRKEQDDKNYADFIPFESIKEVLEVKNAFSTLAYALTSIPTITTYWTNDTINVSNKSEYKFLAVVFTFVLFDGDEDAMRFAWNMAENYVTEYDTFVTYCRRAGEIYTFKCNDNCVTFYKALSSVKFVDNISDQLKEEITKAKQILDANGILRKYNGSCKKKDGSDYQTWEEVIIEAEKYAFFKGAIRFLFTKEKIGDDWEDFEKKWTNASKWFTNKRDVRETTILLKNFLSTFASGDKDLLDKFVYDNKDSSWREILLKAELRKNTNQFLQLKELENDFENFESQYEDAKTKLLQEELIKTDILKEMTWAEFGLRDDYNHYFFMPYNAHAEWKKYVLATPRNKILTDLFKDGCISFEKKTDGTDQHRLNDSGFYWGWNIKFQFEGKWVHWNVNSQGKEYLYLDEQSVILIENYFEETKKTVLEKLRNL